MFVDLGTFINEKELYNQKVNELKSTIINQEELEKALAEEKMKFKGITRKYLPTALSVIKNTFKCDYSLYKIGRDVDANFNTIETNVNKTQTEIAVEMNQFVQQANTMGLSADEVNKLNLSIDIIMSYVDDTAVSEDQNKAFYLNHTKVVASSLDLPVTQKIQEPVVQQTIQYNPYANQPLNLNNQVDSNQYVSQSTNGTLVDPFANIYNNQMPIQNNNGMINASTNNGYQTQANTSYINSNMNMYQVPNQQQALEQPIQPTVPVVPIVVPSVQLNEQQANTVMPNEGQSVNRPTAIMPNVSLIPDDKVVTGKEKNGVVAQIICSILIPVIVLVCSFIIYFVMDFDFVSDFLLDMPGMLNKIAVFLIIATVCLICSGPIIKVAKSRTVYLERFIVAPMLLSLPISWLFLKMLTKIQPESYETALKFSAILLLGVMLFFPFCLLLLMKSFVNSDNRKTVKAPVWSIFDKLGMLMVIYTIVIPAIYIMSTLFEIEFMLNFMNDIMNVIYFVDNPSISQHLDLVFLVGAPVVAALIMITRTMIQKRVGSDV